MTLEQKADFATDLVAIIRVMRFVKELVDNDPADDSAITALGIIKSLYGSTLAALNDD